MKKKYKRTKHSPIIYGGLVIALAIAAWLTYAGAVTPDTATYKTITNEQYHFSLDVPANWEEEKTARSEREGLVYAIEYKDEAEQTTRYCLGHSPATPNPDPARCQTLTGKMSQEEKERLEGPGVWPNIFVRVYTNPKKLALQNWLVTQYRIADGELADYAPGKKIRLGGRSGLLSNTGCCAGVDYAYTAEKDGYIYEVGTNSASLAPKDAFFYSDAGTHTPSFETIVKRFHFLP